MNCNYDSIKKFTHFFYKNIAADVQFFVECVAVNDETKNKPPVPILIRTIDYYIKKIKLVLKHNKIKANTSKWKKKKQELDAEELKTFGLFVVQFNSVHLYQTQFLKYLWLLESKNKRLTIKDAPESFSKLLTSINIFDSTDKEMLKTFNSLRNIVVHSPMEIINTQLNCDALSEMIILLEDLENTNQLIATSKGKEISLILQNEVSIIKDKDAFWRI